jgi:hypothetical protein
MQESIPDMEDNHGKISSQLRHRLIEANVHGAAERDRQRRAADVDKNFFAALFFAAGFFTAINLPPFCCASPKPPPSFAFVYGGPD